MRKKEFYTTIAILIFGVSSIISPIALSYLTANKTIKNTGLISTAEAPITYKSEVRGVFVHAFSLINPDWNVIAQTLSSYGINLIVIEATGNNWAHYRSAVIPYPSDELGPAVAAAHSRGMKIWAAMNVMLSAYGGDGKNRKVVSDTGAEVEWLCPTKQASRDLVKAIVEEMVSKYDIDGFMFDYIRYDTDRMCFCEECHQKFVSDTGITDVVWRSDVVPGGKYHKEFMEWRIKPITELVRDMRSWMLAIKPNLQFSVAAWTLFQDAPTYWRYWLGQDTADWVAKDYVDVVAPMMYTTSLTSLSDYVKNDFKYMVAGPEGKVPLLAFLTTGIESPTPPDTFKEEINLVRSLGVDGWIIWRYGGPGDGQGSTSPDIRNYLSILDMPSVFQLANIQVSAENTSATITWKTELPATSLVEYSTSPLFNATFKYNTVVNFNYWDVDHDQGFIKSSYSNVTSHTIVLTDLRPGTKYYFRVQSADKSGIATSKVMTFTTSTS